MSYTAPTTCSSQILSPYGSRHQHNLAGSNCKASCDTELMCLAREEGALIRMLKITASNINHKCTSWCQWVRFTFTASIIWAFCQLYTHPSHGTKCNPSGSSWNPMKCSVCLQLRKIHSVWKKHLMLCALAPRQLIQSKSTANCSFLKKKDSVGNLTFSELRSTISLIGP